MVKLKFHAMTTARALGVIRSIENDLIICFRSGLFHATPKDERWYICCVRHILAVIAVIMLARSLVAQRTVSCPATDGGIVYGDVYGGGARAVLLAHGGQFNKESWKKQAIALTEAGFLVLAIDFRGYGPSRGPGQSDPMSAPLYFDVLAAVHYLRSAGAKTVSVVGPSLCGWAAGNASIMSPPGEIDRLVFL